MADREKAINCLTDIEQIMVCRQEICPREELQYWIELQEGVADALALLKEQDTQNVVDMRLSKDWFRIASCPRCNELLQWVYHRNHCGYCGQAVKWE